MQKSKENLKISLLKVFFLLKLELAILGIGMYIEELSCFVLQKAIFDNNLS